MKSLFLEIILKEIFIDNKERQISEEICKILNIKTFHQANTGTCYIDYLTGKHSIQIRVSNHNSNPSRKDLTADYTIDISTSFNPNNIKQYIKDEIQRIDKENLDFKKIWDTKYIINPVYSYVIKNLSDQVFILTITIYSFNFCSDSFIYKTIFSSSCSGRILQYNC